MRHEKNQYARKALAATLSVVIGLNSFFLLPQRAEAGGLPVIDFGAIFQGTISAIQNTVTAGATTLDAANSSTDILQKYAIRPLAIAAAKAAINAMTQSIVQWINSGFQGSPAFSTNLNRNLRQLADGVASQFVTDLITNTTINSPFLQQVTSTVAGGYLLYTSRDAIASRIRYTLNEYSQNEQAFRRGQFNEGGFNALFAVTRDCGNDPFCVQATVQEGLVNTIDRDVRARLSELDWGRGFLSWRNCPDAPAPSDPETASLSDADTSSDCTISTPGSILESAMGITATSPLRQLELAESFDQIIGALASQLVSKVFSATGLLGASEPDSGGSRSTLQQAVNNPPSSSTLALIAAFEQQVTEERANTLSNQQQWQSLRATIAQAIEICSTGTNEAKKTEADHGLAQADALLAKAPATLASLAQILQDIAALRNQPNATYTTASSAITSRYNQILQTGNVPTPSPVLKSHMEAIVTDGCN